MDTDYQKIKAACLKLLNRREYSQHELLTKLALKGFSRSEIQCVLEELQQQGWQNDERFAQDYVKSRLNSGFGLLKIQYELKQRGIKNFDIDAIVKESFGSWENLLLKIYRHKYPHDADLTAKEKFKRQSFLQQRGFTNTMINGLFKQLKLENQNI
jgi:regulatory protein